MNPANERHLVLVIGANGVGKTSLLKRLGVHVLHLRNRHLADLP